MKKYILIISIIMMSFECFGGMRFGFYPGEEKSNGCNVTELGVSEDNAISDMGARFRPNVMMINWKTGDETGEEKTINIYDSKVLKPQSTPSKQGYKFVGWKVSGVKTCADFSTNEDCGRHSNCAWIDNACALNPCLSCVNVSKDSDEITCEYGIYDNETGGCSYLPRDMEN